jgi:hypothetical protein
MDDSPDFVRDLAGFRRASDMMRMLLNGGGTPAQLFVQFGTHGYQLGVMREHLAYLRELETSVRPISEAFWPEGVAQWKITNDLLLVGYSNGANISERIKLSAETIAASMAFPLLEEIARRVARAWDEDGTLAINVPETMGLFRINSKGKREAKTFKSGHRIVDLAHKLFVMKSVLHPALQKTIENLDERLSQSPIQGLDVPHVTLFERFEFSRNQLAHGRRFFGIEAWLVTLFIALLYFWLPQTDEDRRLEGIWAQGGADGNLPLIQPRSSR